MRSARTYVLGSMGLSLLAIGAALFSISSVRREFDSYGVDQWIRATLILLPLLGICCWPWIAFYVGAVRPERRAPAKVYSGIAALLAVAFGWPIAAAPAEGIGAYTVFYVLSTWAAYVIVRLFSRAGDENEPSDVTG